MNSAKKNPNHIDRFRRPDSALDTLESEDDGSADPDYPVWSESDLKSFKLALTIGVIVVLSAFLMTAFQEKKPELTPQEKAEQIRLNAEYDKRLEYEAAVRQRRAEEEVMNPALAEARRRASQPVSIGVAPGPGNTATVCASQGDATSCRTIVQGADGKAYMR